ncbi:hypothetical protein [Streptomyces sp. AC495_CC817]|uniref:hypothetical protein n=1 Tax=Streptomyces sp. AC495_CC817 TaxID=2823900 RepID=UPI001C262BFF|nr:hypothetical protein [Streptomyces sp. AC495_CC817]
MRRARLWLIGGTLVLAAGLVSAVTPSEDAVYDAFLVRGDGPVTGRTLIADVDGATFTPTISSSGGDWEAEGNWLVVEVIASAPTTEVDAEIAIATLRLDGRVFQASERVRDSIVKTRLHVGTDTRGILAFELPAGIDGGRGELRLTTQYLTPQLDDVVVLPLSLDDAEHAPRIDVDRPEVTGR